MTVTSCVSLWPPHAHLVMCILTCTGNMHTCTQSHPSSSHILHTHTKEYIIIYIFVPPKGRAVESGTIWKRGTGSFKKGFLLAPRVALYSLSLGDCNCCKKGQCVCGGGIKERDQIWPTRGEMEARDGILERVWQRPSGAPPKTLMGAVHALFSLWQTPSGSVTVTTWWSGHILSFWGSACGCCFLASASNLFYFPSGTLGFSLHLLAGPTTIQVFPDLSLS